MALIKTFEDFKDFQDAIKQFGVGEDLTRLTEIDYNFFDSYGDYVIINLRDYSENPNNLMVLSETDSFLYSDKRIGAPQLKLFAYPLKKKFGESTVLAYLVLKSVLASYSAFFDKLNSEIDEQEEKLDPSEVGVLQRKLRKVADKVEDFVDFLIKLEDREIQEVNTNYISYDYDVMLAKAKHLLDRIKSHHLQIVGLRNEIEIKSTRELNKRIENLSYVVKKLTALTLILMIPNIVAGHFGMNLKTFFFINTASELAEPIILGGSLLAMSIAAVFLRWKGWL